MMIYYFLKIILFIPLWLLFPTIRVGHKIPKGKMILVCNHRSNLDIVVLHNILWCGPNVLAKKELFDKKILKPFLKILKAIPVDRDNVGLSTIKQSLSVLKNDKKLFIFPEGTRSKEDNQGFNQIKGGTIMFALRGKSDVLPMYLVRKPKLFRLNKLIIGQPISFNEYFDQKMTPEITEICGTILKEKLDNLSNYDIKNLQ